MLTKCSDFTLLNFGYIRKGSVTEQIVLTIVNFNPTAVEMSTNIIPDLTAKFGVTVASVYTQTSPPSKQ